MSDSLLGLPVLVRQISAMSAIKLASEGQNMANDDDNSTENLLKSVGSFGRYQCLLLVFTNYAIMCWAVFTFESDFFFLTAEPQWKCVANSSVCNITGTLGPGEENYDFRCGIPRKEWEFVFEYTSIVTEFDLVCDKSAYGSYDISISGAGSVVGALILGLISDKFGRKKTVFLCGLLGSTVQLICSFAQSFWAFAPLRFIIGGSMSGIMICAYVLGTEYVGIHHRALMGTSMLFSYGGGLIGLALIGYLVRDWRKLTLVTSLFGLPGLLTYFIVPESLRWLLVKKRNQEAIQTLKKVAKINRKTLDSDDKIQLPTITEDRKARLGDVKALFGYGFAKTTLVVWYIWFVSSLVYAGVHLSAPNVGGNVFFNWFLAGAAEIVSVFFAIQAFDRLGRKRSLVISLIASAFASLGAVILTHFDDGSTGFYAGKIFLSMVVAKFFITIAYNGVYLITSEIYPTVIRNTATGSCQSFLGIGVVTSTYIVYLKRIHLLLPFGIFGCLALIAGLLCLSLKETKGQPTRETLPETPGNRNNVNVALS